MGVATAAEERDEIIHQLRNLVMVLSANLGPLAAEQRTDEGRAIVADLISASDRATRLLLRLAEVL